MNRRCRMHKESLSDDVTVIVGYRTVPTEQQPNGVLAFRTYELKQAELVVLGVETLGVVTMWKPPADQGSV